MNNFLSNIRKRVVSQSESIDINGETYYVVPIDNASSGKLIMEAERKAAFNLASMKATLTKTKATNEEKKAILNELYSISPDRAAKNEAKKAVDSIKTKYDIELMIGRMSELGYLMAVECLRSENGGKIYNSPSEKKEIIEWLSACPDVVDQIQEARERGEKKRTESN